MVKYIALYSPSSVNMVVDFVKTIYVFPNAIPVVINPIGAAAQFGVPEAYKLSYKIGKPLVILPSIEDLREVLGINRIFYYSETGSTISLEEFRSIDNYSIVFGAELSLGKKELLNVEPIRVNGIPPDLPTVPLVTLILYLVTRGNW
ncbi:MAG: RecB-family nuclease [Desulfurococcaceae archaeon]